MKVSIIAIGDELLIGQVIDTNSGQLAAIMEPAGWSIDNVCVVHDSAKAIREAIENAFRHTDIVLTTGGLGPTKDDITKQVMCEYFGGELREDPTVLENVKEVFLKRNLNLNRLTAGQAMVPSSCRVIQNLVGTAPIMWFDSTTSARLHGNQTLIAMPGVPFEAIQMFRSHVFPLLLQRFPSAIHIAHRCVILTGITESAVAESLDDWEKHLPESLHLAYLPKQGVIRLRLDGSGKDAAQVESLLDEYHAQLIDRLQKNVIATADLSPEEALINILRDKGMTLATAESCTGGNIAHRITEIAGCSDVFMGGIVSYANEVKQSILGVNEQLISTHGVVSEPVVKAMAEGACRAIGTDCAIATSGIAGPGGATPTKPVGTVCIAATLKSPSSHTSSPAPTSTSSEFSTICMTYHFPGTRDRVIDRASTTALTLLIQHLKNIS